MLTKNIRLKEFVIKKNKKLKKITKSSYFFMKIKNYHGNYQTYIKKIEISKIEISDPGYHGCVRLHHLLLLLLQHRRRRSSGRSRA